MTVRCCDLMNREMTVVLSHNFNIITLSYKECVSLVIFSHQSKFLSTGKGKVVSVLA